MRGFVSGLRLFADDWGRFSASKYFIFHLSFMNGNKKSISRERWESRAALRVSSAPLAWESNCSCQGADYSCALHWDTGLCMLLRKDIYLRVRLRSSTWRHALSLAFVVSTCHLLKQTTNCIVGQLNCSLPGKCSGSQ